MHGRLLDTLVKLRDDATCGFHKVAEVMWPLLLLLSTREKRQGLAMLLAVVLLSSSANLSSDRGNPVVHDLANLLLGTFSWSRAPDNCRVTANQEVVYHELGALLPKCCLFKPLPMCIPDQTWDEMPVSDNPGLGLSPHAMGRSDLLLPPTGDGKKPSRELGGALREAVKATMTVQSMICAQLHSATAAA
ncbi:hypothetical protein GQ53DRAFT_832647 [Thozetella sp. PMI_491]|nr:hypothetical protein GQ53DRAFT_832647 [Thozetella sp. PMI_491]